MLAIMALCSMKSNLSRSFIHPTLSFALSFCRNALYRRLSPSTSFRATKMTHSSHTLVNQRSMMQAFKRESLAYMSSASVIYANLGREVGTVEPKKDCVAWFSLKSLHKR